VAGWGKNIEKESEEEQKHRKSAANQDASWESNRIAIQKGSIDRDNTVTKGVTW